MEKAAKNSQIVEQRLLQAVRPMSQKAKLRVLDFAKAVQDIDMQTLLDDSRRDAEQRGLTVDDVERVIGEVRRRNRR